MNTKPWKLLLLAATVSFLSGCSMFASNMTRKEEYTFGSVKFLDAPSCRRLKVKEENAIRADNGRLEVKITWENTSDSPFRAQVRRIFIDEQGLRERGAYQWDSQVFPPGETTLSWKSYSTNAVHYKIEIRKTE